MSNFYHGTGCKTCRDWGRNPEADLYAHEIIPLGPVEKTQGLRYNEGKNQLELIPPEWLWALGLVLTRGAAKYELRNWEKGMKFSFLIGCILRHVMKRICGEIYDVETGCHHLAHAAWNCLALMSYDIRKIGENDLVGNLDWLDATAQEPGPALKEIIEAKAPLAS